MRNDRIDDEKYIWERLAQEYVSLYKIELNSGKYEILRFSDFTNAIKIVGRSMHKYDNFDIFAEKYVESFIPADAWINLVVLSRSKVKKLSGQL